MNANMTWGHLKHWILLLLCVSIAGLVIKLPDLMGWSIDSYLQKNIGLALFPWLVILCATLKKTAFKSLIRALLTFIAAAVFINGLEPIMSDDVLFLVAIHLPILYWVLYGLIYLGPNWRMSRERLNFLRHNGDLLVLSAVLGMAGLLTMLMTFALYELIGIQITEAHVTNIITWGAPAVPLTAVFLLILNPELVKHISPLVAKIFTPLVFFVLSTFTLGLFLTQHAAYQDRQVLLVLNGVLISVMALILFSISTLNQSKTTQLQMGLLFFLSAISLLDNTIALSSVVWRLLEMGLSPNRVAVFGANVLIWIHLFKVALALWQTWRKAETKDKVEQAIAGYLPVYALWCCVVCFVFPWLF
jgi:hypothetical protein